MAVIEKFIEAYTKKLDFYREAARFCSQICETTMEQMGIRTIVTSRAKKPERLRNKLEKREFDKKYNTFEDIMDDIADLSGVRIALYFPGDLSKVQQFIESNFTVKERRIFPEPVQPLWEKEHDYKKRFSGYWATHYRVYLKEKDLSEDTLKYSETLIEIQIASALMHAWAEVEHDLVYKPYSGELSFEEYQILDELNGLVLAGEIALERLQKAVKNRVSQVGKDFNNHYELAMFLYNKLGHTTESSQSDIVLGRVDLLFQCIKTSEYNNPESLKELLLAINHDIKTHPVVEQIIDKFRSTHPDIYEKYHEEKQSEELKYQFDTLRMNRENGNRQGEANTLANIGYIYSSKENYDEAIQYFAKAVGINHEIGGIQGEANQLLNLGSTYRFKGDLDQALEYCNRAAELHKKISYKQGQANTLGMIGNIYSDRVNYKEAFVHYKEALEIYRETKYRTGEVIQLNNLGMLFLKQRDFELALQYYFEALETCQDCDYKQGEGDAFQNIGTIYFENGKLEDAIMFYEKALSVQESTGNQKNSIGVLLNLGKVYHEKAIREKAIYYFKEAYLLSNSIEYKKGAEEAQEYIELLQ
ncbi:MAG: hypothetical protein K0S04_3574 [Herbinix sp.]|jgi:tetratricopeptide (TPR) repeat protein|nr:hypothetical protein [Herbinix sp.]